MEFSEKIRPITIKTGHNPKSATSEEYHIATGVEALFGYLYLMGNESRIKELFALIFY